MLTSEEYIMLSPLERYFLYLKYFIVFACCSVQFVMFGMMNNFGSIKYHWNNQRPDKNIFFEQAGSFNFGFLYFCSILAFKLISKIGPARTFVLGCFLFAISTLTMALFPFPVLIFIMYGMVLGIGAGLVLFSMLFELKELFGANLAVANGIVSCGSCIGTMVQSQFINPFCDKYGWKVLFIIYTILAVFMMLYGIAFHYAHSQNNKFQDVLPVKKESSSNKGAFLLVIKNFRFMCFCLSCFVFCSAYLVIYLFIVYFY